MRSGSMVVVRMARSVLALCMMAVAVTSNPLCLVPNKDQLLDSIPFDAAANAQTIFRILNNDGDESLTPEDLNDEYYLAKLQAEASGKFISLIDGPDPDEEVNVAELTEYLKKTQVKLVLYECGSIKSTTLRNICLRDRITNYNLLVLDDGENGATTKFFNHLEDPNDKDNVLTDSDLKRFMDQKTVDMFLEELGATCDKLIDQKAFNNYITHEDFGGHFRFCKINGAKDPKTGLPEYNVECLTEKLKHFIKARFTELDQVSVFNYFQKNKDQFMTGQKLSAFTGLPQVETDWFVGLLRNPVTYGDFRSIFRRTRSLRGSLLKECEHKEDEASKEDCSMNNLRALIHSHPVQRQLSLPELDVALMFEALDTSNDGQLVASDLAWAKGPKDNFMAEVGGPATYNFHTGTNIELDEFQHYTSLQHMVFGLGDCMNSNDGNSRLDCYTEEYENLMSVMIRQNHVEAFYNYLEDPKDNDDIITLSDLQDKKFGLSETQAKHLLEDMSMGLSFVAHGEFEWFVRQEALLYKYEALDPSTVTVAMCVQEILWYVQNKMTEYDVQSLFFNIDKNKNMELAPEDFAKDPLLAAHGHDIVAVLDRPKLLGMPEPDSSVNYLEWWLFFNTPTKGSRKNVFFDMCAKPANTPEQESNCYKNQLVESIQ